MSYIAKLSNFVLAAKAMNNLKRYVDPSLVLKASIADYHRIRARHPRYFSSITLFHRALRVISTNHFQAPVRRFILDLFEIGIEMDTLIQLRHIEASLNQRTQDRPPLPPPLPPMSRSHGGDSPRSAFSPVRHQTEELDRNERRRRSASSPGPEPPGRVARLRGLTISEVG